MKEITNNDILKVLLECKETLKKASETLDRIANKEKDNKKK